MKIRQNIRHFAARKALELPLIAPIVTDKLVALHTRIFLNKADESHREDRRAHLDAFFEGTIATYLEALQSGYTEAEAREITHIQANFDFYNHGWTEMMEFPIEEVDNHYDRYRDFFEAHDITVESPLGRFEPISGVPDAPATPELLDEPRYTDALGGYADDVYVEDESGEIHQGDIEEPSDIDPSQAPGMADYEESMNPHSSK